MSKKTRFHAGNVWLEALCDFENELHEHVEKTGKDQLRFQTGRLYAFLIKRIKAEATGRKEWSALFYCYRFMTDTSRHLGYDEPRRLHGEEMAAKGLFSPRSFCSRPVSSLDELMFRVRSIASWMEAQESFSLWLVFKDLRQAWRGKTLDVRAHAIQASYLSKLPQKLLIKTERRGREVIGAHLRPELGIGTNYDNKPWDARQWQYILEQAARLTEKTFDCPELERWLWWCYSVFRRYGWNTREVRDAAIQRGLNEADDMPEENFRRRMLTMGLPLKGRKQKRNRPPLAQFITNVALPDSGKMWGAMAGYLTKKKLTGRNESGLAAREASRVRTKKSKTNAHGDSVSATGSAADDPALLKRRELARTLNTSTRTIDNLQRARKIPFIRLSSRCVRFSLSAVLRALQRFEIKEATR